MNEYIKHGRENAVSKKWMNQLENASARVHVSRLEALELRINDTYERLYSRYDKEVGEFLEKQYTDDFQKTVFEIQKGVGVAWDVPIPDKRRIESVISKPWTQDGLNFSDRIWRDKNRLINETHKLLTQNMILGKAPDDSIKQLSQRMGVSRRQAGRLIMTESAYFGNLAQRDAYKDLGVEEYQILETLDTVTCGTCGPMDGQVFKMSEFDVGATAPPFHPNCRGTTVPYFDDAGGERIARDAEGNHYSVPGDMTYEEWRKKNEENTSKVLTNGAESSKLDNKVYMEEPEKRIGLGDYVLSEDGESVDVTSVVEFKPLSRAEIAEMQQQSNDVYRDKLTRGGDNPRFTEKGSLDAYTNGFHTEINPLLYGKLNLPPAVEEKYWEDINRIDLAMGKWELKRNVTVYSGTKAKHYADWLPGDEREIPAFLSSSVTEKKAKRFVDTNNEPLMLEIFVPKGTRSIYIGDNTAYKDKEDELLLGRELKYRVIERTNQLLRLEVLP